MTAPDSHSRIRPALPAGIIFRVRCQGHLHRISWRPGPGGLIIHDHRTADLWFTAAIEAPCPCAKIFAAIRDRSGRLHDNRLPLDLRQALREYTNIQTELGHGRSITKDLPIRLRAATTTAWLTRRMHGLFHALARQGLVLEAKIDLFTHMRTCPPDLDRCLRIDNRSDLG